MRLACSLTVAFCLLGSSAYGSGVQINEISAGSAGRVNAAVATPEGPASIFYNPAGLSLTKGLNLEVTGTLVMVHDDYIGTGLPSTNPSGEEVNQGTGAITAVVPSFFASYALSDSFAVGLGVFAPYGLTLSYEDDWVGRTGIQEASLVTLFISPSFSANLGIVQVAANIDIVKSSFYLRRTIGAEDSAQVLFPASVYGSEATTEVAGDALGVGASLGVIIQPIDELHIGVMYRSAVKLNFEGFANFDIPESVPAEIAANFPDQPGHGEVVLPHVLGAGIGWEDDKLTLELGTQITFWETWDETRIFFSTARPSESTTIHRNWKNTPIIRLGGSYEVIENLPISLGIGYDFNPVPDETFEPSLPDMNRLIYTAGVGYSISWFRADLSYLGIWLPGRELDGSSLNWPATGRYEATTGHLISLSLGVRL